MLIKNRSFYVFLDLLSIVISYLLAAVARAPVLKGKSDLELWFGATVIIFSYLLVWMFFQPSREMMRRNNWNELRIVTSVNLQMAFLMATFLYLLRMGPRFPRSFYITFFLFNLIWMYMGRVILKRTLLIYYGNPRNRKKLLICANPSNVLKVMSKFVTSTLIDYEAVALLIAGRSENGGTSTQLNLILHREDGRSYMQETDEHLEEYLKSHVIDEALLSLPESGRGELDQLIRRLETMGINTHVTINTFRQGEREKSIDELGCYRVLTYSPRIFEPWERFLKRTMDLIGGVVGAVLTLLLGLVVVPAIKLESPGPAIFKQVRIGRNGRRFFIYKFRSMYMDAEARKKELEAQNEMSGLMFKVKDDPRITKVGKWIRKTSIDEFPQFFNVLKGDMSLVGTRPPTEEEFLQYEERHKRRLSLKPGITGMWQVKGRNNITDFESVVKLDLEYIDNWSIWLDIRLLFQTVFVVLFQRGAS